MADADPDRPESGYLLMLDAERQFRAGEHAESLATARWLVRAWTSTWRRVR